MRDALAGLAQRNRRHGVASTVKFIPGTSVPDLTAAKAVAQGLPDLRIMFDAWHFARSGGRVEDIDTLPPDAVGGVQISDWLPPEPGAPYVPMSGRLMPSDGCLPLAAILARIEANSPGLDVGIEVFNVDLARLGHDEAARTLARKSLPYLARDIR